MSDINQEQQPPEDGTGPDCWELVLDDMESRRALGVEKYGKPLRPDNGRNALVDAYQESLDLVVYLRAAIEQNKALTEELSALKEMLAGDAGKIVSLIEGQLQIEHWAVRLIVASLADTFLASGARNYFEMEVTDPDLGPLVVTVQRQQGETPGQLKSKADSEIARIQSIIDGLTSRVAAQSEALSRTAEKNPLTLLELWRREDIGSRTYEVKPYMVRLEGMEGYIVAFPSPGDYADYGSRKDRAHVVIAGSNDCPGSPQECIKAGVDKWAKIYGGASE